MTEPTEAEIEAAALVALAEYGIPPDIHELLLCGDAMRGIKPGAFRAALTVAAQARWKVGSGVDHPMTISEPALTAAAQVRERGGELAAPPQQERDLETYTESVARTLHEAHQPYCDYTYPFEDPMSSSDMYRALARAVTLVRGPALMPIYSATEPTAASQAEYLRQTQFVEEHLYEHGVGSSDELGKCFPATEDYPPDIPLADVLGMRKGEE